MDCQIEGDIDFDGMISRLRAVDGTKVSAGLFGGEAAEKAMYNEYGTSRGIPARPFLRNTLYEHDARWGVFIAPKIAALLDGGSSGEIVSELGNLMANDIKGTIAAGGFAALSPATIAKKGSSKPLVDTGDMFGSITWKEGG